MSELQQAINEMRNMRESYDQIGAAAEAYNTGKVELAANITAKGVQASATETLPELAEKVNAISQETYEINGGEMYAKQLFGSLETPNYWNLYDVLAQLLSDGRLVSYGGILLAEYYKGYDSIALAGAGAGGAYVVSDLDENGQFKMYTEDTTHTWATEFDGKGNRWVAYCFADEYHDFEITNSDTSPRSIHIGRKIGAIKLLVSTRTSEVVVTDGNHLRQILSFTDPYNPRTFNFGRNLFIRNLENFSGYTFYNNGGIESVYISFGTAAVTSAVACFVTNGSAIISSAVFDGNEINIGGSGLLWEQWNRSLATGAMIIVKCPKITVTSGSKLFSGLGTSDKKISAAFVGVESMSGTTFYNSYVGRIYLGYDTNDKTKSVSFWFGSLAQATAVTDFELQDGWCKPLGISQLSALTKEIVQAHIFDRLGVNDLSTGTVTITLANAVLNLFTQEEIDAVVARTNITIVGA